MSGSFTKYLSLNSFAAIALGAVMILFTVNPKYVPLAIGVWGILTIADSILGKAKYNWQYEHLLLPGLYLLFIIGTFYSDLRNVAYFDLEVKMSMFIVPLLVMFARISRSYLKTVFYCLIFGASLQSLGLLTFAFNQYRVTNDFHQMFYTSLSQDMHPSYLSFYVNTIILILLLDHVYGRLKLFKKDWIYLTLIAFFSLFSVLLLSKVGIITTAILDLILLIIWIKRKQWKLTLATIVISTFTLTALYQKSDYIRGRLGELIGGVQSGATEGWLQSTSIRRVVWAEAITVYKEKPLFGHGTGDVKDVLMKQYEKDEAWQIYELNLNAHNQFLQTGIAVGILGILFLIAILISPILFARKNFGYAALFSMISLLFFMTESVLETQAGVVGFVFFYSLFNSFNQILFRENEAIDTDTILSS